METEQLGEHGHSVHRRVTLGERVYRWGWHLANRVRVRFGQPAIPKRCCRHVANLGPVVTDTVNAQGTLTYRRCQVCQCRHFELEATPGRYTAVGR
jgi:hypothetical protein